MAKKIILVDTDTNQVEKLADVEIQDEDWEERCYRIGCHVAREVAIRYLEDKEEQLYKSRPDGFRVKDKRPRTLVTRFGDITFKRRLYQDKQRRYHFLLDEHLSWRPNQAATTSLTSALVDSATRSTFRWVSREVAKYTADAIGMLSASTVHGLLQRVAQDAIKEEKQKWQSCFEQGCPSPPGKRRVDMLFTEADGLWIHLQQEEQKRCELKCGITYEGGGS